MEVSFLSHSKKTIIRLLAACLLAGTALLFQPEPAAADATAAPRSKPEVIQEPAPEAEGRTAVVSRKDEPAPPGKNAAVSLKEAVAIAKKFFPAPAGFDKFESNYYQEQDRAYWSLRWYRSAEDGGELSVNVNAANGEILNMHIYDPAEQRRRYRGLPAHSRAEAQKTAAELAARIYPGRFPQTTPVEEENRLFPVTIGPRGAVEYYFLYRRVAQDIEYPENHISVQVNADTLQVTGIYLNWNDELSFPDASGRISPGRAGEIFRRDIGMEPFYFWRPERRGSEKAPVKLLYRTANLKPVYIDALTGKLLHLDELFYFDGAGGAENAKKRMDHELTTLPADRFTPVELEAIENIGNLLTREKALAAVKKVIEVPAGYRLQQAELRQNWQFPEQKVWHFSWQEEEQKGYLNASVDAATGEFLTFQHSSEQDWSPIDQAATEKQLTEDQARRTAEDFMEKLQPERHRQVLFLQSNPEPRPYGPKPDKPRSYHFSYIRLVNEIKFPANGFGVTVNALTGKVTGYRMDWWKLDFPSPAGIMDKEEAAVKFLEKEDLILHFQKIPPWTPSSESKIYLVYDLLEKRRGSYLDAFTGELLDYEGNPVKPPGKLQFNDTAGHPSAADIDLLAQAGILAGEGEQFRPEEEVSQAHLVKWLVLLCEPSDEGIRPLKTAAGSKEQPWHRRYYDAALRLELLTAAEIKPDSAVTRLELARLLVNARGLKDVAVLGRIFNLDVRDAESIGDADRGYAALAAALRLVPPEDESFHPAGPVTRGQAASALVRLLRGVSK